MNTSPKKLAETPWTATKNSVQFGIKLLTPTFLQLIVAYFILDLFVYMWNDSALFSAWRDNAQLEKVRYTLGQLFGTQYNESGRVSIVFLIFGIAMYISTKKFGRTAMALSGPVSVIALSLITQVILRWANKWNDDGQCAAGTSVGCVFQTWYTYLIQNHVLGNDDNSTVLNAAAVALGYMAAI